MSWNYRIVCHIAYSNNEPDWIYTVNEVYYSPGGEPGSLTKDEVSPCGENKTEFYGSLEKYIAGTKKSPLYFDCYKNKFIDKPEFITPTIWDDINKG